MGFLTGTSSSRAGQIVVDEARTFRYRAVAPASGDQIKGRMQALGEDDVARALIADGWVPLDVVEVRGIDMNMDLNDLFGSGTVRFKNAAAARFFVQLHQLLAAGLGVTASLEALAQDADAAVAAMCEDMATKIAAGERLSTAMEYYPKAFSDVAIAYVRAGEESGDVPGATKRLATVLSKRARITSKVKQATAYPKLVSIVIIGMVVGIITMLVPKYGEIYASFGAELPAPTQFLINVSNVAPIVLAVVAALGAGAFLILRSQADNMPLQVALDRLKFRIPVFGSLTFNTALYRWASTLGGALRSGIPTAGGLELAARAAGYPSYQAALGVMEETVRAGQQLSQAMAEFPDLFPARIRALVATGVKTGHVEDMLDSAADILDEQIEDTVASMGAKLEVGLILIMAAVVGGIVIVLYLPLFSLAQTAQSGMEGNNPGSG